MEEIYLFYFEKQCKEKSKRSGSQLKRCSNIFFTRCGLSSMYHLVPLALLQYDTKPTRQCDSIMLIHDSLDTGGRQYYPNTEHKIFLTCPQTLASPLLPLADRDYWELIPFPCQLSVLFELLRLKLFRELKIL